MSRSSQNNSLLFVIFRVGLTDNCTKRHWHIEGSVATEATGTRQTQKKTLKCKNTQNNIHWLGVKAGLDWLVNELKGKRQKKKD
jgi:hypothetical protein